MRGLKPPELRVDADRNVASFTDAWIETKTKRPHYHLLLSHLLQMRGLKQLTKAQAEYTEESHLLQMRGLKHFYWFRVRASIVSHLLQMRGLKPVQRIR